MATSTDPNDKYRLPSGLELMSRPIVDPGATVKERELQFVLSTVSGRLYELLGDENFELKKGIYFILGFLSSIIGVILILVGFHLTVFFQELPFSIPALVFAGVFFLPMLFWCFFVFIYPYCWRPEYSRRKQMHMLRKERKKPSHFNEMAEAAQDHAKPPIKLMKVKACFHAVYYPLDVSDLRDFCNKFEQEVGLPAHQQLVKYKGREIFDPDLRLDDGYNIEPNDVVHVYNKGGFLTPQRGKDGYERPDLERGILIPRIDVIRQRQIEESQMIEDELRLRSEAEKEAGDKQRSRENASIFDMFIGKQLAAARGSDRKKTSFQQSIARGDRGDDISVNSGMSGMSSSTFGSIYRGTSASIATAKIIPLQPWEAQFVPKTVDILQETSKSHGRSLHIAGTFHKSPPKPHEIAISSDASTVYTTKTKKSPFQEKKRIPHPQELRMLQKEEESTM